MEQPTYKPRLPVYGAEDGQQVLTSSGNIFEFNAEKNEWVCIGIMPEPDVVSPENDGLVPPELYRKLSLVQELIEQGFDFSSFKLETDVQDPYYYFFHSSDDLVKFSPEKCLDPKEVKVQTTVSSVIDNDDGTSTIELEATLSLDYAGLVLETFFCNYNIISNTSDVVVIDVDKVNILSGDTVKIVKPETMTTKLRIEVDKGRLYQKLIRNCCVGPKGGQGDQGDVGSSGNPASSEVFQLPLGTTDGVFSWEAVVETPLDTPISLRIFRQDNDTDVIVEVIQPLDDSSPAMVIINDETVIVEETPFGAFYDPTSKTFSGSLTISEGGDDISTWKYKARQQGAKGKIGDDGKPFLEVITSLLEDPTIRSTRALVSLRRGTVDGDIVIFQNTLFDSIPVSNLSAAGGSPVTDILKDEFAAVSVTVEEAKDIGFYKFTPKEFDVPPLDIPLWTPTDDCVQSRRWAQYKFDWFNKTEPDYLFSILLNPKPPEQCCQEDFFFCPNVGDNPCGVTGEILPPLPSPVDCECECENPSANGFIGGVKVLSPIDLTSEEASLSGSSDSSSSSGESGEGGAADAEMDENVAEAIAAIDLDKIDVIGEGGAENLVPPEDIAAIQLNTVESVIDGVENNFIQNITLVGNGEIIISLDYDADPCGGNAVERQSCAFVDSNAVRSFFSLTDKSGTSVISGGGVLESLVIPSTLAFTVTGMRTELTQDQTEDGESEASPGDCIIYTPGKVLTPAYLQLEANVNITGVNYCRGFRFTVLAISDENVIICPPTETVIPLISKTIGGGMTGMTGTATDIPKPECMSLEISTFTDSAVAITLTPVNTAAWVFGAVTYKVNSGDLKHGKLTGKPPNLTYTPDSGFSGSDYFQYSVSSVDNSRDSNFCKVSITVHPIADDSFTGEGKIVFGGAFSDQLKATDVLLGSADYVQVFPADLVSIGGTGDEKIYIGWPEIGVGNLQLAPSGAQTPLAFDNLQDNIIASINDFALSKADSAYDVNGPFGVGTYVLANDFVTSWGSRIPNVDVREDTWTNVIAFFNEPQDPASGDEFRFYIMARLKSSKLIGTASSVYANDLFNSGIADGVLAYSGVINDDPMTVIKAGSITFAQDGAVTIAYQREGVDQIYPETLPIEVVDPVDPIDPPAIGFVETDIVNSQAGGKSELTLAFTVSALEEDGQICILFPAGFDISDVNGICSDTIDGTFTATKTGQLLKILRAKDGTAIPSGTVIDITIKNIVNAKTPGDYFFTLNTAAADGVIIDGPEESDDPVTIVAGKPDPITSMIELVPAMGVLADGLDTTMVVITARDKCGNLVEGVASEVFSSVMSDIIVQPMFTTDANGEAVGTIAATLAGARVISAEVECPPSGPTIAIIGVKGLTFSSSGPVDSGSTVEASPSSITANGSESSTITITVVDGSANPVEGAVVVLSSMGAATIFQPGSPTDASGQTTGTISATVAGTKTISAVVNGSVPLMDTAVVNAVAGSPSDSNSMISSSPSNIVANGSDSSSITVSVYDAFNNPVFGEMISLLSSGSNNTFTPEMGVTNMLGVFSAAFTTTTAEAKNISAVSATLGPLSSTTNVTGDLAPPAPMTNITNIIWDTPTHATSDALASAEFTYTTSNPLPIDGKIIINFQNAFDVSGVSMASSGTIDGTFTINILPGDEVEIARNGDGTVTATGVLDTTIAYYTNPVMPGYNQTFIKTVDGSDVIIDDDGSVQEYFSQVVAIPCLLIGGSHYPASQFDKSAADVGCASDHWHDFGPVCSLDQFDSEITPGAGGSALSDPDPLGCGHGTKVPGPPAPGGIIMDFGTPDLSGIPEVAYSILSADYSGPNVPNFLGTPCPPVGVADDSSSFFTVALTSGGGRADGFGQRIVTIVVRDAALTLISGEPVTINVTGSLNAFATPQSGVTDINGEFSVGVTTRVVETKTFSANLTSSIGVLTSTQDYSFGQPAVTNLRVVPDDNTGGAVDSYPVQITKNFHIAPDAKFIINWGGGAFSTGGTTATVNPDGVPGPGAGLDGTISVDLAGFGDVDVDRNGDGTFSGVDGLHGIVLTCTNMLNSDNGGILTLFDATLDIVDGSGLTYLTGPLPMYQYHVF